MKIESLTNAHVKNWGKLKEKKYRDELGLFLVEGDHLIEEAQKKNCIKEILSKDEKEDADFYVTPEIMRKISQQVTIPNKIAVCYKLQEEQMKKRVLVLDGIQDPGNLGTIIRSAVAFNFDTIVLSKDTVDLYNEKVIRASEGMLFHINIIRTELISFLEKNATDYSVFVTDVVDGEQIKEIAIPEKVMLIIGNEGNGVKEEIKKYKNHFIKLNMNANCESLNAGVAASILMYEINEASHE